MTDYQKFKKMYDEIDELIRKQVTSEDDAFITWHTKVERFLQKRYGKGDELKKFNNTIFSLMLITFSETRADYVRACRSGLESTKATFKVYLEEMEEEFVLADLNTTDVHYDKNFDNKKVFIVHGHDDALKESVARLIERQGIKAVILNEQVNKGATIIEKFETNSDVSAAVCLFTPDDEGKKIIEDKLNKRARQNVIFETGYFMGKLGRERVIMIASAQIELPSDMQGVVYTSNGYWQLEVLKELKAIGFDIDFNVAF